MKKEFRFVMALLLLVLTVALAGCGAKESADTPPADSETPAAQSALEPASGEDTSKVADASQMTTVEDVVQDGMTPIPASELVDGAYEVAVDCSSSMFRVERCELTVADGKMTALLTMSGSSYGYVYPGTAAEAAAADASAYIAAGESADGKNTFLLPVDALDAGVACAAWSKNKELWYDRTLVFRSDSLPLTAFKNITTAASLGLANGKYDAAVTLAGGSGKASVASPCWIWVVDGVATARIVWSSANYDYMLMDGERYDAEISDGHSGFLIPVAAFNRPLRVIADTTAMSQAHEIEYTLTFDSASLKLLDTESRP